MNGVVVRLLEPGFENFSDYLGEIEFKDGVSVNPISQRQAQRICSTMRAETIDGADPSEAAMYAALSSGEEFPVNFNNGGNPNLLPEGPKPPVVYDFTRESLEGVADQRGIAGLREIARPYGIKGNSIISIIDALMALKEAQV